MQSGSAPGQAAASAPAASASHRPGLRRLAALAEEFSATPRRPSIPQSVLGAWSPWPKSPFSS